MKTEETADHELQARIRNETKQQAISELKIAENYLLISQAPDSNDWVITGIATDNNPIDRFMEIVKDAFIRTVEDPPEFTFKIIQERKMGEDEG